MQIAIMGLGRMGMNMARRLLERGHQVHAYNTTPAKAKELATHSARPAYTVRKLVEQLEPPRVIWLMLPRR